MAESKQIRVPDIGNAKNVDVIEVLVKPGDTIEAEQSIITLESEKASMDIPAPFSGVVTEVKIKAGDKVSEGDVILTVQAEGMKEPAKAEQTTPEAAPAQKPAEETQAAPAASPTKEAQQIAKPTEAKAEQVIAPGTVHAGPAVRRIARELGVDLTKVSPTGPKQRILRDDVQQYVKGALTKQGGVGSALPQPPTVDFSKFGEVETKPLNKIKRLTGTNLHRNWLLIPHVTQFDEADITELEAFRKSEKAQAEKQGYKLTPLVFIMKAIVAGLKAYPQFNASLDASGETLIMKKYYNIGVAVDTPNGLVVPVIRDVDKKSIYELAKELAEISNKAREKGLSVNDMQGGCFSISSLGGIGGTAFTPIVNLPEVAILGISKAQMKPVYQDGQFVPRLMLPLSLSYDHRVIDGADGARFTSYLAHLLSDIRRVLL